MSGKKSLRTVLQILPFLAMLFIPIVFLISGKELSAKTLFSYTPDNYILAAVFILALYAVKSLSVFLPVTILNILAGSVFPVFPAMLLNTAGIAICITVSYLLGSFSGADYIEKLTAKYPFSEPN